MTEKKRGRKKKANSSTIINSQQQEVSTNNDVVLVNNTDTIEPEQISIIDDLSTTNIDTDISDTINISAHDSITLESAEHKTAVDSKDTLSVEEVNNNLFTLNSAEYSISTIQDNDTVQPQDKLEVDIDNLLSGAKNNDSFNSSTSVTLTSDNIEQSIPNDTVNNIITSDTNTLETTLIKKVADKKKKVTLSKVKKRDGRIVDFSTNKIYNALKQAFMAAENKTDDSFDDEILTLLVNKIVSQIKKTVKTSNNDILTVEVIQDVIEDVLLKAKEFEVAKAFIRYRANRTQIREAHNDLITLYHKIHNTTAEDFETMRDNANVNGNSPMGIMRANS